MIVDGYDDFNIRENENQSIASFIKMTSVQGVHEYLYIHYFENDIKKLGTSLVPKVSDKKIKKSDKMKLDLNNKSNLINVDYYEKKIIQTLKISGQLHFRRRKKTFAFKTLLRFIYSYVTLQKLIRYKVLHINTHVITFANNILDKYEHMGVTRGNLQTRRHHPRKK